jgi:hypothetical protein
MSREDTIWDVWGQRGVYAWKADTHGRGLEALVIEGPPLPPHDRLEFRLVPARLSGKPYDAIVCEGVIVEKFELP